MNLVLLGKISTAFLACGGAVLVGYFLWDDAITLGNDYINLYAISQDVKNDLEETSINNDDDKRNYACRFDKEYYNCVIKHTKDFDTKKQISFESEVTDNTKVTNNDLKTKDNIYQIQINKSIVGKLSGDKQIEVIQRDKNATTKYASLKYLFVLDKNNDLHENTKTQYFIVKTTSTSTTTNTSETLTYKYAATQEALASVTGSGAECNVYDFSSTSTTGELNTLTFVKPTAGTNSAMQASKYYLVDLKNNDIKAKEAQHINISKTTTESSAAAVTIENEVIAAAYISEKDGIFIFKKFATNTQNNTTGTGVVSQ